ncbi:hypothetical protein CR513_18743, partial [Mucuna pruriens]
MDEISIEHECHNACLKMQIGQLANLVSQIQSAGSGNLPFQTIPNAKGGNMSFIMLRSVDSQVQQQARTTPLPFPSQSLLARKPKTDEDLLKMFGRVEINIALLYAIKQVPNGCTFSDAMLDLGASINVMPASVYKSLNFGDLEPTGVVIQLANRSIVQPVGILEDVLVQVNELIFLADFYMLDMEGEMSRKGSTLILGRPFLMMATMKHPPEDHSLYSVDMIEELVEEFTQQLDSGSDNMSPFVEIFNMFPCASFVTEEADKTKVLDPSDSRNHVNRPDNLINIFDLSDLLDEVCKHDEEPECSISARIQVAKRPTLS